MTAIEPLSQSWAEDFRESYGRWPTDLDRQDRLFSLMIPGSGPDGAWIPKEWEFYGESRDALWSRETEWPVAETATGYDRFEHHLQRLAGHYGSSPEATGKFCRAAGLVWGGIAYEGPAAVALFRASVGDHLLQLEEGASGWLAKYVDDDNPAHHWVAAFLPGYNYGALAGALSNSIRDVAQLLTGQGGTLADIRLGNVAAFQGAHLRRCARESAGNAFGSLLARMRVELRDQT